MGRSKKVTLTITWPLFETLESQIADGTIDYPNPNAAVTGLILYQGLSRKEHTLTSPIAYMHLDHQDAIHDFVRELNERGLNLMGSFIRHVAERVAAGEEEPDPETIEKLHADQILSWARRWQQGDEAVWEEIQGRKKNEQG